ncbi:DUF2164 domain-containing protein [Roseateles cellulosilyticus]|uniref:DUF2164 domain-containing protein n=1 Tax=Pelomonas cellulosilytica TaxID=2906762 RepID=A0ABS8XSC8_9BURK|nr:DUF2164 domain-containing protein [Pelomonas sp. P8]MCE4553648.1 DUF2164 domain-containing protein [Pelomonas sp. P8]
MTIELDRAEREQAIASLQRYLEAEFDDRVGNLAAGALLGFFLEEIAPLVYNQAVTEVQERLAQRVAEVDVEVHEDAFQYWSRRAPKGAGRR